MTEMKPLNPPQRVGILTEHEAAAIGRIYDAMVREEGEVAHHQLVLQSLRQSVQFSMNAMLRERGFDPDESNYAVDAKTGIITKTHEPVPADGPPVEEAATGPTSIKNGKRRKPEG